MPKTSTHYIKILLDIAKNIGLDDAKLMAEANISSDVLLEEDSWIDVDVLASLVKGMWQASGDETLGISPRATKMGTWALACDYMLSSETLGDLYRRGKHVYSYLSGTPLGIDFSECGDDAKVEVFGYVGDRDPQRFLMEFLVVVWHRFACWSVDKYIPLKTTSFTYEEPSHSSFYDELYHSPVVFNGSYNGFVFCRKLLKTPVCRSRDELNLWLRESPADLLYMPGRDTSIASYIQKTLSISLNESSRFPSFQIICDNLNMSPQVVRRRLEEEGASYQKIKDTVRVERIKELLINPDLPMPEVSERSGFTEVASLNRAFKKWTGLTPAQYRKERKS